MSDSNWWETAKRGDEVECVDDEGVDALTMGRRYTISRIITTLPKHTYFPSFVRLEGGDRDWCVSRFRPVPKPQEAIRQPETVGSAVEWCRQTDQRLAALERHSRASTEDHQKTAKRLVCLEDRDRTWARRDKEVADRVVALKRAEPSQLERAEDMLRRIKSEARDSGLTSSLVNHYFEEAERCRCKDAAAGKDAEPKT